MNSFRFHNPWVLILVILAIGWAIVARRRRRRDAITYSSVELLRGLPKTAPQRVRQLLPWLKWLGATLVIVAIARPQLGEEAFRVRTEGIAIEMCLDRSGSMLAQDFSFNGQRVTRLAAVKQVFRDFVIGDGEFEGRPDDPIGLIVFGGFADAMCPHTLDHGTLVELLDSIKVAEPIMDRRGNVINDGLWQEEQATAIGDAVVLAVDRLKDVQSKSRVAILLSDGENTTGVIGPEEAAEVAKEFGIKVYTIGVGTTGMAPFAVVDSLGRRRLEARQVKLDEATLKMLAETSGGQYFNAQDIDTLGRIYAEIDQLETTAVEGRLYTRYRERCQYLLLPGLACIFCEIVLAATWLRSLP